MNLRISFVTLATAIAIAAPATVGAQTHTVTTNALHRAKTASRARVQGLLSSLSTADIDPFSTIKADTTIVDSGSTLTIAGRGWGFDANLSYISFFYGTGSVSKGSLACLPPTPNNLTIPQMITAYWLPVGSTYRTLTVVQSGASYTPISTIGTMSVRYDTSPTTPITPATLTPGRFFLNSCGRVKADNG